MRNKFTYAVFVLLYLVCQSSVAADELNRPVSSYILMTEEELDAQALLLQKRVSELQKEYQELGPAIAELSYQKGMRLLQQSKEREALLLFTMVLRVNPDHEHARTAVRALTLKLQLQGELPRPNVYPQSPPVRF